MSDNKVLFQKLTQVLSTVAKVKKSGWNDFQKYAYIMEADLLDAVREELVKRNVFIFTSAKVTDVKEMKDKNDKTSFLTTVETTHTFVCGDTGASFSVNSVGQGHDSLDKGVYKGITGSSKYFLLKNFLLSAEGDDPENDGVTKFKDKPQPEQKGFSKPQAPVAKEEPKSETPKAIAQKGWTSTKPQSAPQQAPKPALGKPVAEQPKQEVKKPTFGKAPMPTPAVSERDDEPEAFPTEGLPEDVEF